MAGMKTSLAKTAISAIGALVLGALVLGALMWRALADRAPRPNILLVSIDCLRADHVGCYGYRRPTTPALDRLAAEGVRFETAVSTTSWTLPAHAAMLTGLPDRVHGCYDATRWLDGSRRTLAEAFHADGYETAGFFSGPWLHPYFGFSQGFDQYEDCTSYLRRYTAKNWQKEIATLRASMNDAVTNAAALARVRRWLDRRSGRPFFLFVHLFDVHPSFVPPPPYDTMFSGGPTDVALYDGEVRWTDETLRALVAELERRGLKDETLIVVTADHGIPLGERTGFDGLYEANLRIPLVMRYPSAIRPGVVVSRPASLVDLAPTILDLAARPPLADAMGRSLVPLIRDPAAAWEDRLTVSEVRGPPSGLHAFALRAPTWKVIMNFTRGTSRVFDLVSDPGERRPLDDPHLPLPAAELAAVFTRTMADLDAAAARMPALTTRAWDAMPTRTRKQLRSLGYLK